MDVREAYLTYAGGALDLRAGRQIHTWGVGDLLFINDLFPKNYAALFSGRPMEYLKTGAGSFKAAFYSDKASLDLVAIPFFEPDQLPTSRSFFLFDPFSRVTNRVEDKPRHDLGNTELAARLYRPVLGFDAALYAYRFLPTPLMEPDSMTTLQSSLWFTRGFPFMGQPSGKRHGRSFEFRDRFYDSRRDRSGPTR